MHQLILDLNYVSSFAQKDFYMGKPNEIAYKWINAWPKWPKWGLVIYGGKGCGKTHLAYIWQNLSQALFLDPESLQEKSGSWYRLLETKHRAVIIDFPEKFDLLENAEYQKNLLHFINFLNENQGHLLICHRQAPINWVQITLNDLKSRLQAMMVIPVYQPDDEVFREILTKLSLERGIPLSNYHMNYLLKHSERSYKAAQDLIKCLDQETINQGITINHLKNIINPKKVF